MKRLLPILALVALVWSPAWAQSDAGTSTQQVIIQTTGVAREVADVLVAHGDTVIEMHPSIDGLTAIVHSGDVELLRAATTWVTSVSTDAVVDASAKPGSATLDEAVVYETLHETLGLAGETTGSGVGVAIIDSGLKPVGELKGRILASYDFTSGEGIYSFTDDDFGHGTHVAGLIGGQEGRGGPHRLDS